MVSGKGGWGELHTLNNRWRNLDDFHGDIMELEAEREHEAV